MTHPLGALTDVPGVLVGHHARRSRGWRTGATAVVVPGGAVAGVHVGGGGPGTRETDALAPGTLVDRIHAVCLSGGSAYGLAAAHGVMEHLAERGLGVQVGDAPAEVVPVVPAAVVFDLGRGGRFRSTPDAAFGRRAARSASSRSACRGAIGAGTGAIAGGLQGGLGTASIRVDDVVVAALMVVNARGSVIDPETGLPWETDGLGAELRDLVARRPSAAARRAVRAALTPTALGPLNTTIGVVATSADLDVAEATTVARVAHDGLARAVRPAHSPFDGDTIFVLATGTSAMPPPNPRAGFGAPDDRTARRGRLGEAAARCVARACVDAVLAATSHPGPPPGPPAYSDLVGPLRSPR